MKADIAVFDPRACQGHGDVRGAASYTPPGSRTLIVNGQVVYEGGAMTSARPGKVLYGPGKK
jgi:N-acyl-D-aspartate/D-glutamate deacylase